MLEKKCEPAQYIYCDKDGNPHLKVVRTSDKNFLQYRWDGENWASGAKGHPVLPYRLPELLAAVHDHVFIVEGEKDTDNFVYPITLEIAVSNAAGEVLPNSIVEVNPKKEGVVLVILL